MSNPVPDELFARLLTQLGGATLEQINAAKAAQVAGALKGAEIGLADVLIQQGVITPAIRDNIEKKAQTAQQGGIQKLGNYRLLKKLGEGGMGAVYLAEDSALGRKVALKVLPKRFAGETEFLTRFRREAKAAGKLNHINIVSAHDAGEDHGHHYYAMEYCAGEPLDKRLSRGTLDWAESVQLIIQVAEGLKYAHAHGFVHRDIKPANLVVTAEGVVKILDLGLSKDLASNSDSFNTQSGIALGTPHYIAPEQASGSKNIDGRADIYSLGATFYHLVTGKTPFEGPTPAAIMLKHLNDQLPNPQDLHDNIPDGVVQVIQRMMAKDPADRYADCAALLADLNLIAQGKPPQSQALDALKSSVAVRGRRGVERRQGEKKIAATPSPPRAKWNYLAVVALVLALVSSFALTRLGSTPTAVPKKSAPEIAENPKVNPPPSTPEPLPPPPTQSTPAVPQSAPTEGLIAYWPFEEKSGELVKDLSGNGHLGKLYADPKRVRGVKGMALDFSSDGAGVGINDHADFNLNNKDFTISMWASIQTIEGVQHLMVKGKTGWHGWSLCTIGFVYSNEGMADQMILHLGQLKAAPEWIHLVVTANASTREFSSYLNAELQHRKVMSVKHTTINVPGPLALARTAANYMPAYRGKLDEIRIYNRVLNRDEIRALYDDAKPGN